MLATTTTMTTLNTCVITRKILLQLPTVAIPVTSLPVAQVTHCDRVTDRENPKLGTLLDSLSRFNLLVPQDNVARRIDRALRYRCVKKRFRSHLVLLHSTIGHLKKDEVGDELME